MCNWGFQPSDWWCWITGSRSRNLEPLTWSHYIPSQCQESLTQQQHHIPEGWKPWFLPLNQSKFIQLNSDEPLPCTSSGKIWKTPAYFVKPQDWHSHLLMFKATLQLTQSSPLSLYLQWMYLNYPPLFNNDDVSSCGHDFLHNIHILCTTYWPKQCHNTAVEYVKHWLGILCFLFTLLLTSNWCHTNTAYNVKYFFP